MTSIVHVSDLHFGEAFGETSAETLLGAIEPLKPDLVAVSGDLTRVGRSGEFAAAAAWIARLSAPTLVVPGNHDIPARRVLERMFRPTGRFRRAIGAERRPAHTSPGLCVLGLNSARPVDRSLNWSHGRLSGRQGAAITRHFAQCEDDALRVLVVHHPFFVPEDMPRFRPIRNRAQALRALVRARVDLVLAGHLHRSFWRLVSATDEPDGWRVLVVQASTALGVRTRGERNAFNQIELEGDRLRLTCWEREPGGFAARPATEFARTERGWAPVGE